MDLNGFVLSVLSSIVGALILTVSLGMFQIFFKVNFSKTILILSVNLNQKYRNKLYQNIARGYVDKTPINLLASFSVFFLVLSVYFRNIGNSFLELICMLTSFIVFFYLFFIDQVLLYKEEAINYVNQSINIILPFISDLEVKQLKSKFASIKSKDDYLKLAERIKEIAKDNNIKLLEFDVI